ncbi:MAG: hypothetical protein IT214_11470 [Chitinophagaceae bacterium]|nr:hypothetical protein [Chitinophagaceae bacterium]
MKKCLVTVLPLVWIVFLLTGNLHAQISIKDIRSGTDLVEVNSISTGVSNVYITDSLSRNSLGISDVNKATVLHTASFEIALNIENVQNILKVLYSSMQGQSLSNITFKKLNATNQVVEQRNYSPVTVKEIVFPGLDAVSKEPARARITIQGQNLSFDNKGYGSSKNSHSKTATINAFAILIDGMTTNWISRISSLRIVPASEREYLFFSLEFLKEDIMQWYDWLNTVYTTATGSPVPRNVSIKLTNQTMKNDMVYIELPQVEIVSISSSNDPNSIPKTTVLLRTTQNPVIN